MSWTFKGMDAVGSKGWVYGDLVHNQKVTRSGLEPRTMVGGYEVLPESVCICTGVKDSSGRLIYEDDIMTYVEEGVYHKGYVEYQDGRFVVKCKEGVFLISDEWTVTGNLNDKGRS